MLNVSERSLRNAAASRSPAAVRSLMRWRGRLEKVSPQRRRAARRFRSSGWAVAFGDLRNGPAAAARDVLDCTPRLARGQHAGDTFVTADVFWTPLVSTFGLGLR